MLDRPWPMNSWLPDIGCPDLIEIEREIDTASVSANSVIANANGARSLNTLSENSGVDNGGNCLGRAPNI